jgi:hypothetical protein
MALDLVNLLADYNGAAFLAPGTAEWGYVEPQWFLQIPHGANLAANGIHVVGTSSFGPNLNFNSFLKANYHALLGNNALGNTDKALFGAMLRAHLVSLGCLDDDLVRRGVLENEYRVMNAANNDWAHVNNDIPDNANAGNIARYVKKFGDTIMQLMVYVFCARGHHWQDEYDQLYDRLMAACGVQRPNTWSFPTNRELFRQILHCFGVRIPLEAALWCRGNARMCNPMRLRFTPHTPIAGAAQILTLNAALNEMHTEGWWTPFSVKFQAPIAVITQEVATIAANPYEYHVASRVLTGVGKRNLTDQSLAAFTTLAQYALGYIDHLGKRHSLAGQKVLTQKTGGPKALADAFAKACDTLGKPSVNVASMTDFINSL